MSKLNKFLVLALTSSLYVTACTKVDISDATESPSTNGGSNDSSSQGNDIPTSPPGGNDQIPGHEDNSNTGIGDTPPGGDDNCPSSVGSFTIKTVTLNQGEPYTKSQNAIIYTASESTELLKMKISENSECRCGDWEPFNAAKPVLLKRANAKNEFSIQYKDFEARVSKCVNLSIIHDNLPPTLSIVGDNNNKFVEPALTKGTITISDAGSGIKSWSCKLNGISVACQTGITRVQFEDQREGNYTLEVAAMDNLGLDSITSLSWVITSPYQKITQNYEIKSNNKVDILIIDDNSISMEYEQKSMAKRMSTFLDVLEGLDWRIAITTTDPNDVEWGDGKLLKMQGPIKDYFLHSGMNINQARASLEKTIQRSEQGSGSEQGIRATYRSIERSFDKSSNNYGFYRSDAHFAAVVISDEDESGSNFRNFPENLLAYINQIWPEKNFAFHSIIARPNEEGCLNGEGHSYGYTYDKMSKLTGHGTIGGAIIGSVCAEDYGSQLVGIGKSVQEMKKVIELDCVPVGPTTSSVLVNRDGSNFADAYEVQGQRIVFQNPLPSGKYQLLYRCL